jgi:hypothetical protein
MEKPKMRFSIRSRDGRILILFFLRVNTAIVHEVVMDEFLYYEIKKSLQKHLAFELLQDK